MSKLIERLSPKYPSDIHAVVSEVIKGIIAIAAPSPGSGVSEGASHAPPSNLFARELALRESLSGLTQYILNPYGPDPPILEGIEGFESESVPNHESSASAVIHSIAIIIELIRQNNSDYFEPYLFHTLRNRLIQYQQQIHTYSNKEGRQLLEKAMQEMVDRMGVVHLGPLLDIVCDRLEDFQRFLVQPRSHVKYLSCLPPRRLTPIHSRQEQYQQPLAISTLSPLSDTGSVSSTPSCYTPLICPFSTVRRSSTICMTTWDDYRVDFLHWKNLRK